MEDLRWAEETASVFGDEAAQMQIDSSGGALTLLLLCHAIRPYSS